MELSPNSELSLPLFEHAIEAYHNEMCSGGGGGGGLDDDQEVDLMEDVDSEDQRDPMGEMILTAKLMVTKGMEQGEKEFKPNDINMLNYAILYAAERVVKKGGEVVRATDVVDALWHIYDTGHMFGHDTRLYREDRRHRADDMAEAMVDYTKGIKGKFFNREGPVSWPDCDLLVLDLKMLSQEGYEDILYLTFIGLMNSINNLISKRRGHGRQTVVINDEASNNIFHCSLHKTDILYRYQYPCNFLANNRRGYSTISATTSLSNTDHDIGSLILEDPARLPVLKCQTARFK